MSDFPFVMAGGIAYTFTGAWHAGDSVSITWTGVTVDSPCGGFLWALNIDTPFEHVAEPTFSSTAASSFSFTLTHDTTEIGWAPFTSSYCSSGTLHGGAVTGGTTAYCQYGTTLTTPGAFMYYLTPGVIDAALTEAGLLWLAPLFTALWFTFINTQELCGSGPPPMPTFDAQDFVNIALNAPGPSQVKVHQALEALFWPLVCSCSPAPPGSPPPISPLPPTTTQPPGLPITVINQPVACDDTDICTLLNQIVRSIASLQRQVLTINNTTTLVQRQKTPFAYVPGTLHSGLTGAGQFAVQGILGLAVQLTTLPPGIGATSDDPIIYFRAGWVATGTTEGWRRSVTVSHNPMWLDVEPDDTLVGYTFEPGTVANILELIREP